MDSPELKPAEATQADRDAAANWYYTDEGWPTAYAKAVHLGTEDGDRLVQAFARHRINTRPTSPLPADIEGLVERLRGQARTSGRNNDASSYYASESFTLAADTIESLATSNEVRRVALEPFAKIKAGAFFVPDGYDESIIAIRRSEFVSPADLENARKAYLGEEGK